MVGDVRGPARPPHDRRFGSILPDIRQNTPKTAITDSSDRGTCGERGPDLGHNPRRPLDIAHVIALARPDPEWSTGLIVATTRPNQYTGHDLAIYPVGD